ncbi:MAG TPA: inositol monophosphatase family protein [Ktedonobacterales bacterium]|jgi:myo-inositol-1(or 4)-monophosphatase
MTNEGHETAQPASAADTPARREQPADDMLAALAEMFWAVRSYLLGAGREGSARGAIATNPKGEMTRAFDAEAERIALDVAAARLGAFRAFSEEQGELTVGGANPRWTLVIDPCDGSNNFRRGVRATGFAVAALPGDAPLDPARVEYAVCGDIFTGTLYSAVRGSGAWLDGAPCSTSSVRDLRHAMVSINIGRVRQAGGSVRAGSPRQDEDGELPMPDQAWRLMGAISTARRIGATVLDLCYVAQGAFEAYVDVRGRLTPENFMAPALIIQEAGGMFTDVRGRPLGPVAFTAPYNVIAAGNAELHAQILRTLATPSA